MAVCVGLLWGEKKVSKRGRPVCHYIELELTVCFTSP